MNMEERIAKEAYEFLAANPDKHISEIVIGVEDYFDLATLPSSGYRLHVTPDGQTYNGVKMTVLTQRRHLEMR